MTTFPFDVTDVDVDCKKGGYSTCMDSLTYSQVGSSGILDKVIILPFREDVQNFTCIKKPTLPESSLELLREVDPKIQYLPSVSCNGAMQEDKSKTYSPSSNATEHAAVFEDQNCDKSQLEVSCADKNKHAQHDDATMLGKNKVVCGLNVHGAPECHGCNLTLDDKISEANCLYDQNIGKSTNDIQKCSCNISVSISCQDGYRKTTKQDSNKQSIGKAVAETSLAHSSDDIAAASLLSMSGKIPQCRQDKVANDFLRVSPEQGLCIKCGKGGQLLQCSSCLLSAHDSCFGSSLAFEGAGKLNCPVCICAKATKEYKESKKTCIEALKRLDAFLDDIIDVEQLVKQHKQQTRLLPRAVYGERQLNGHNNSSKRQISVTATIDDLAHLGEAPNRQRKKHKINDTSDACNEVVIEKVSSIGNSDVAPMNASVLQNKSNQLQDAQQNHVENIEAHEGSSSAGQEVETDKVDGLAHSHHHSKDSPNRYSNHAAPTGRRPKVNWTVKEEATLREAMKKFTPQDSRLISLICILEHGKDSVSQHKPPM